jgi:hypothetical protein
LLALAVAAVGTVVGLGIFMVLGIPFLGFSPGGGLAFAALARRRSGRDRDAAQAAVAAAAVALPVAEEVLDPAASTGHRAPILFAAPPARGVDRCRVGSRLVPLRSEPGELVGVLVGRLDVGDEVDILRQEGSNCFVRTPSGAEGWVPGMALLSAAAASAVVPAAPPVVAPPSPEPAAPIVEVHVREPEASVVPPGEPETAPETPKATAKRPRKAPARSPRPEPRRGTAHGGAA